MWNPHHVSVSPPGCGGASGRRMDSYRKGSSWISMIDRHDTSDVDEVTDRLMDCVRNIPPIRQPQPVPTLKQLITESAPCEIDVDSTCQCIVSGMWQCKRKENGQLSDVHILQPCIDWPATSTIPQRAAEVLQRRSHSSVATVSQQWITTVVGQATPQAMPQAIFRKFRNFSKIAPGFALRLRPRANKNLHIPSGYASGVLLHHICPQGRFMQIFNPLGPQAFPSGYAPGQ
ncbi:hypothetical protein T09_10467 [Trichinella sp. T9]|nr:hypothetical protein T09_10467 [Trichinella sp. T9]